MKITVTRFDPSQDASPYEQSFEVPYRDNITALEALMHIYENEEPIAFDYSCHGRSCGRCAMMVDGFIGRYRALPGMAGARAVATGGSAGLVTAACRERIIRDPDLTLKGLRRLYENSR